MRFVQTGRESTAFLLWELQLNTLQATGGSRAEGDGFSHWLLLGWEKSLPSKVCKDKDQQNLRSRSSITFKCLLLGEKNSSRTTAISDMLSSRQEPCCCHCQFCLPQWLMKLKYPHLQGAKLNNFRLQLCHKLVRLVPAPSS